MYWRLPFGLLLACLCIAGPARAQESLLDVV